MTRSELDMLKEMARKGARLNGIDVAEPLAQKNGFILKPVVIDETHIAWEYVQDPNYVPENDGTDYTRPITYVAGMSVTTGLWYTDGEDIWEAIKDGIPASFSDAEYFDIIQ